MAVQQNKSLVPLVTCVVPTMRSSQCSVRGKSTGEVHLRHHVSPDGFYRGRKVVDKGSDE